MEDSEGLPCLLHAHCHSDLQSQPHAPFPTFPQSCVLCLAAPSAWELPVWALLPAAPSCLRLNRGRDCAESCCYSDVVTVVLKTALEGPSFKDTYQTMIYQARIFSMFKFCYTFLPLAVTEKIVVDSEVLWKQRICTDIWAKIFVVTC